MSDYNNNEMLLSALLCLNDYIMSIDYNEFTNNKEHIIEELNNCIRLMILCNADRRKLVSQYLNYL